MKRVILMLAIASIFTGAFSRQYTLSGSVTDSNGDPLTGANVVVNETYLGTATNLQGEFSFSLDEGEYNLTISFLGYEKYEKDVNLNKDIHLNVVLKPATVLGDEVIVKATRANVNDPVAYTDVSNKEIESRNLGQDLPFLLNMTPSIVTTSDAGAGIGYTNLRIRGTSSDRINVTVNGIPLNDAESHGVYWVDLPDFATSLNNVQIQRGVGTSTNGAGAFGGTINFQTRDYNKDPYAEYKSAAGSFNTFNNSIKVGTGLLKNHFTLDARLSKITSDGYIDRASSNLKSFFVSGGYYSPKTIIRANIFSGIEKTYQAWNGVPKVRLENNTAGMMQLISDAEYTQAEADNLLNSNSRTYNFYTYKNQTDNYQQDNYQLFFSHEISPWLNVNAALHYTYGRGYYEEKKNDQNLADYQLNPVIMGTDTITHTDLIRRRWLDNDFYGTTYSINFHKSNLAVTFGGAWNKYDGRHFGRVIWARYSSNGEIRHEWYRNTGIKTDFNNYLKINYQVTDNIGAYGDFQYRTIDYEISGIDNDLRDISQKHYYDFLNPKFGLNYNINDKLSTYFSFGIAHREPNRDNFTDADPEKPGPTYETLRDYELGYKFKSAKLRIGINLYYMDYDNQLVLTGEINDVGNPVMTNVKKSYRTGIEFMAGIRLLKNLDWSVNATYSQNKINNFTEYVDNWDTGSQNIFRLGLTDLAFSPDLVGGSTFQFTPFDRFQIELLSKYVGKQYIDNTSSEERKLDPYFINNLAFSYDLTTKLFRTVNFNLMINNLFNVKYESNAWVYRYIYENDQRVMDGYFPQAGRNYLAAVVFNF